MKARPHVIFSRSQHTVVLDLPNDVVDDLMGLSKQVNLLNKYGYRLDPDEVVCMALEDFFARYLRNIKTLLKRVEGTLSSSEKEDTRHYEF